jgi:hypothetical protein
MGKVVVTEQDYSAFRNKWRTFDQERTTLMKDQGTSLSFMHYWRVIYLSQRKAESVSAMKRSV